MPLIALLALAYGPLDWSFPWWLWVLALLYNGGEAAAARNKIK